MVNNVLFLLLVFILFWYIWEVIVIFDNFLCINVNLEI